MKVSGLKNPVMFSWLEESGCRLDAPPFVSGALEAKKLLEKLRRKDFLADLTAGPKGGIFNGPMFRRIYVEDPRYGVPFLTSGSILLADLTHIGLLSKKEAYSPRLSYLRIEEGTTLISCSGTIGRTVYARADMAGMWSSQDVMKVVPNRAKVSPGYLYAFLASKYGNAQITVGTYGAIIQHIEPQHISGLSVPRIESIEGKVHRLVLAAAEKRCRASRLRRKVLAKVTTAMEWAPSAEASINTMARSVETVRRMDAFHHSIAIAHARQILANKKPTDRLGRKAQSLFEPNRGPRMKVEDVAFGVPFLSSSEVFKVDPIGEYLISRRTPQFSELLITDTDILLPRSGQVGGIIGRAVLPLPTYYGCAATEHLVRVRCYSQVDAFYLWAVLASEPGYLAVVGTAFGSSIPSLDCGLLSELQVPWFSDKARTQIVELVSEMVALQASAIHDERKAVALVERAIEELV